MKVGLAASLEDRKKAEDSRLKFIRPLADDNPRLVNQNGLFTRTPDGMTVEDWVGEFFKDNVSSAVLIRITVPNKDRTDALRSLNQMNINHLTLFPDVYGASRFCNLQLEIRKY